MELEFQNLVVVKRSGQRVSFNSPKIAIAIKYAFDNIEGTYQEKDANIVYQKVLNVIREEYKDRKTINVEDIQDIIENTLKELKYVDVYIAFNEYRLKRAASREAFSIKQQHKFVKAIEKVGLAAKNSKDEEPQKVLLDFGTMVSVEFTKAYLLENKYERAEEEGILKIHNLDSYALATMENLHLDLREIQSSSLSNFTTDVINLIRNIKNEIHGELVLDKLDKRLTPIVAKEFKKIVQEQLKNNLKITGLYEYINFESLEKEIDKTKIDTFEINCFDNYIKNEKIANLFQTTLNNAKITIEKKLKTTIKKICSSITMLRPFHQNKNITITLGQNTTEIEKQVETIILEVIKELENPENIFIIYKMQEKKEWEQIKGIKNLRIALEPEKEKEFFQKGEEVYEFINSEEKISTGRMILSTTTINLAKLGLKHPEKNLKIFYNELEANLDLVKNQLMHRYEIQGSKYKESYHDLFEYPVVYDSKKLEEKQRVKKVIKHGVLNIGIVGLGECVCALKQKESLDENDFPFILEILKFIKKQLIEFEKETKMKFILSETIEPKERKALIAIDKTVYGVSKLLNKESYQILSKLLKVDGKTKIKFLSECQTYGSIKIIKEKKDKIDEFLEDSIKEKAKFIIIGSDTT